MLLTVYTINYGLTRHGRATQSAWRCNPIYFGRHTCTIQRNILPPWLNCDTSLNTEHETSKYIVIDKVVDKYGTPKRVLSINLENYTDAVQATQQLIEYKKVSTSIIYSQLAWGISPRSQ